MEKIFLVLIITSFFTIFAFAEDAKVNVCKEDAFKFCPTYTSVHDLPKCLREHQKDLGPECKAVIEKSSKEGKEKYNSCKEDLGKFCKNAPQKLACLHENYSKLTASCKSKFKK